MTGTITTATTRYKVQYTTLLLSTIRLCRATRRVRRTTNYHSRCPEHRTQGTQGPRAPTAPTTEQQARHFSQPAPPKKPEPTPAAPAVDLTDRQSSLPGFSGSSKYCGRSVGTREGQVESGHKGVRETWKRSDEVSGRES